jgi:23S rRNA G2445 N2-methylase RlmL
MRFLLSTDPGIEDVARDEVLEGGSGAEARAASFGFPGQLCVEIAAVDDLLDLTTVHHVTEIRGEADAETLADIERVVAGIELPELTDADSFRVTSTHSGEHEFTRMDIQRVAGAAIQRRYGTRVDLEGFEVNVRVDLYGRHLVAGVQRTRTSLGNRIKRARALRTSLKPTIAAAMVRIAGAHRGVGRLIDPLCGTGTIAIEAKQINPGLVVRASDWDNETVETARATVANHGLDIEVRLCDARSLCNSYREPFDFIVTDPPYGVRLGKRSNISVLYTALLQSFEAALAVSGRIVLVVLKLHAFRTALGRTGLSIVHQRLIESGGLHPRIFVLERG